jgi:hypothetical protein
VTLRARWVTLRARWATLRARWVTLRALLVGSRQVWGYRTEDGLGLLEYFLLAEELVAEPVWVVNAGISAMQVQEITPTYPPIHLSTCTLAQSSNERQVGKATHREQGALQLRPLRWNETISYTEWEC